MSRIRLNEPLLLAALIVLVLSAPLFRLDGYLLKLFTLTGINCIVVLGLALLFGYAGQVSMGHAAFLGIGAYVFAILTTRHSVSWGVAMLAAMTAAALAGLLLALPALRLSGHYLAMATLGFGELVSFAFTEAEPITGGVSGIIGIPAPQIGPFAVDTPEAAYWLIWITVALVTALLLFVRRSAFGRALRAVRMSEPGAIAAGVNVTLIKVIAFVASAGIAGIAGGLFAGTMRYISPSDFSVALSVTILAMTAIGGHDSLLGPIVSAIVIGLLPSIDALIPGLSREFSQYVQSYQADVYGVALILIVIFLPGGFGSLRMRRRGRSA